MTKSIYWTACIFCVFPIFCFAQECPAPQPIGQEQLKHPLRIEAWLKSVGTKVKSIDQFICCLPSEFRKNIMISPISIAAQNGTPSNPRVFLVDHAGVGAPNDEVKIALTVNGGHASAGQHNSVEIAFVQPKNKELEYYDLDFNSLRPHLAGGRNAKQCMNCHGDNGEVPKIGGAKPIFEPASGWSRFVGGSQSCSPEEDRAQHIVQKAAIESVLNNPRYRCLDLAQLKSDLKLLNENAQKHAHIFNNPNNKIKTLSLKDPLTALDNSVAKANTQRLRTIVMASENYRYYKYVIMGTEKCRARFKDWMPKEILDQHKDLSFVHKEISSKIDQSKIDALWMRLTAEGEQHRALLRKLLQDPQKLLKEGFSPHPHRTACTIEEQFKSDKIPTLQIAKRQLEPNEDIDILANYLYDSLSRQTRSDDQIFSPQLRFLFEGRGISMANWSTDDRIGEYKRSVTLDLEDQDLELKELFRKPSACEIIQKKSVAALTELANQNQPQKPNTSSKSIK